MAKLAFLGLGQMGAPMAGRLLEAGHDLTVWNRSPEKASPLVERGATAASSPKQSASGAAFVISMLASPRAVHEVLAGGDGAFAGMQPGATLIEMSTIGPDAVAELASELPVGVGMLDAPVLGSTPQAAAGSLKIFVGGEQATFERARGVLEVFGAPMRVGGLGSGAALKLVVNSTLGALMCTLGEALALADALGLEEKAVLDVLEDSTIGPTTRSKRDKIEAGSYPPNFKLQLALKDLDLVTGAAARRQMQMKLGAGVRDWFEAAAAADLGELDYSAVIAAIRSRPAAP